MCRGRNVVVGILFVLVAVAGLSLATMLLWNILVPSLFKGPSLSYGQALGLLVLSHILFRGGRGWHGGYAWRRERWRKRFEERLQSMSPEERERLRQEWGRRWGCGHESPVGQEPTAPEGS